MSEVVLAVDWFQIGTGLGDNLKNMIEEHWIPALCLLYIVIVGWRTRGQPGAVLIAIVLAATVWWGASSMGWLADTTGETVKKQDGTTNPVAPVGGS